MVNIKQTNDELKSMALNGYWKKCWLEALSDFQEFPKYLDKITNVLGLTGKVLEKGFSDIEETDILESHMLLQKLMGTFNKRNGKDDEDCDEVVQGPQLTTSTLRKDLQKTKNLIITFRSPTSRRGP
jgi:hypothetical protein